MTRLDVLVASRVGTSREQAREMILAGQVSLAGRVIVKPGHKLTDDQSTELTLTEKRRPYVGRGGEKLAAALNAFKIDLTGLTCLDVGASTGGFTDCMLQHGAARVYAVENGTGQLAAALRGDPRVMSFEQTDIRDMVPGFFPVFAFAAVDVSFISLTKVLSPVKSLLAPGAGLVCLVKPQFEAGPGHTDKRGILRDPVIRRQAVESVTGLALSLGFESRGLIPSPMFGGNQEYLLYLVEGK